MCWRRSGVKAEGLDRLILLQDSTCSLVHDAVQPQPMSYGEEEKAAALLCRHTGRRQALRSGSLP